MDERDALRRIVDAVNEAMLDDGRWAGASALIDEAVGAMGNMLTFGDERSRGDIRIFFVRATNAERTARPGNGITSGTTMLTTYVCRD